MDVIVVDSGGVTYLEGVFSVEGEYPDEDGAVDGLGLRAGAHGADQKRTNSISDRSQMLSTFLLRPSAIFSLPRARRVPLSWSISLLSSQDRI